MDRTTFYLNAARFRAGRNTKIPFYRRKAALCMQAAFFVSLNKKLYFTTINKKELNKNVTTRGGSWQFSTYDVIECTHPGSLLKVAHQKIVEKLFNTSTKVSL